MVTHPSTTSRLGDEDEWNLSNIGREVDQTCMCAIACTKELSLGISGWAPSVFSRRLLDLGDSPDLRRLAALIMFFKAKATAPPAEHADGASTLGGLPAEVALLLAGWWW